MFCTKCRNDLSECQCPDLEERLRGLQEPGSRAHIPNCRRCFKPAPICKCEPRPCIMLRPENGTPCGRPTKQEPAICFACLEELALALDRKAEDELNQQCDALRKAMRN